jgi:hypothetical protein
LVNLGVRELDRQYKIDVKRIKVQREEIKAILKYLRKYTYTPSGSRNVRFCINLSRQQLYELYRREFPEILLDLWNRMKGKPLDQSRLHRDLVRAHDGCTRVKKWSQREIRDREVDLERQATREDDILDDYKTIIVDGKSGKSFSSEEKKDDGVCEEEEDGEGEVVNETDDEAAGESGDDDDGDFGDLLSASEDEEPDNDDSYELTPRYGASTLASSSSLASGCDMSSSCMTVRSQAVVLNLFRYAKKATNLNAASSRCASW